MIKAKRNSDHGSTTSITGMT